MGARGSMNALATMAMVAFSIPVGFLVLGALKAGSFVIAIIFGAILFFSWSLVYRLTYGVQQVAQYQCPDCAELVLQDARVCKHCGLRFANDESAPPAQG